VLGAHGAGGDQDRIGQGAKVREEPPVGGAAEAARDVRDGSGPVDAGDHVEPDRRAASGCWKLAIRGERIDGIAQKRKELAHDRSSRMHVVGRGWIRPRAWCFRWMLSRIQVCRYRV
jgi:hypothetical protein